MEDWELVAFKQKNKNVEFGALAGVARWTERQTANREVTGLVPDQGTCLACGPGAPLGVSERQPIDVSLTHQCFSLPPFPSV